MKNDCSQWLLRVLCLSLVPGLAFGQATDSDASQSAVVILNYEIDISAGNREFVEMVRELDRAEEEFLVMLNSPDEEDVYVAEFGLQVIEEAIEDIRQANSAEVRLRGESDGYLRSAMARIREAVGIQQTKSDDPYSTTEVSSAEGVALEYANQRDIDLGEPEWTTYRFGEELRIGYYRFRELNCENGRSDVEPERVKVLDEPTIRTVRDTCQ